MNAQPRLHKTALQAQSTLSNRHAVDRLALVRAEIKALQAKEDVLKALVEGMMGDDAAIGGDEFIARRITSTRKGGLDEDALRRSGVDVERYRKPPTETVSLRVVQRVVEEV